MSDQAKHYLVKFEGRTIRVSYYNDVDVRANMPVEWTGEQRRRFIEALITGHLEVSPEPDARHGNAQKE